MGISPLRAELETGYGWAVDWNLGTGSVSCLEGPKYVLQWASALFEGWWAPPESVWFRFKLPMVVFVSLHIWMIDLLSTCEKCIPSNGCNASLSSDGAWTPRSFAHFWKYFPLLQRGDTQRSGVSMPNWQAIKHRGSGVSSFTVHGAWHLIKVMLVSFSVP